MVNVPQLEMGLKFHVTPALPESLATEAVKFTADVPANTFVLVPDCTRDTVIWFTVPLLGLKLPPPQAESKRQPKIAGEKTEMRSIIVLKFTLQWVVTEDLLFDLYRSLRAS